VTVAACLRLKLIVAVQRSKKERGARKEEREGMAVRREEIGFARVVLRCDE
jgi:hypothetical protein